MSVKDYNDVKNIYWWCSEKIVSNQLELNQFHPPLHNLNFCTILY